MSIKSTYSGHCQCCGAVQKLPGGVLSIHGYTVESGFFNGTCQGTDHLPYELSCDLIKQFIAGAQAQKEHLQEEQASLRKPSNESKAWFKGYYRGKYDRRSAYHWDKVEVTTDERGHIVLIVPDDYGKTQTTPAFRYGMYGKTLAEVVNEMNGKYADFLDGDIAKIDRYIAWQTKRVTDWKLAPLTPNKPD